MALCVLSERLGFVAFMIPKNASSTLRRELTSERWAGREILYAQLSAAQRGLFTFAFLRDPLERLLSAYQEISVRADQGDARYTEISFVHRPEGLDRFDAFLDELPTLGWEPHVRPQSALLANVRVDWFGRVERLQADWMALLDRLGLGEAEELPMRRSREGRERYYGYGLHRLSWEDLGTARIARIEQMYRADLELLAAHP